MSLFRLVYASTSLLSDEPNLAREQIEQILLVSRQKNEAAEITGALLFSDTLISRETWSLVKDAVIADEMPPLTLKGFGRPLQVYELLGLRESVSTKTIRRKFDGMNITIELARGNREQALQVLKELIDEIDVAT